MPKVMSSACAAATAISVTEPARENAMSRRLGTSKEWVTWIQVNSTASGPCTAPRLVTPWVPEMAKKKRQNASTATTASTAFSHGSGRERRR